MTSIKYPLLPRTVMIGGSYEREAAFSVTESRSGKLYFKRKAQNAPAYRRVTFKFQGDDAMRFRSWFDNTLKGGFLPFFMPLKTEWGLIELECRFIPNSLLNPSNISNVWTYTAELMIYNYKAPDWIPPDIDQYPEYFKDRNYLDVIINTQLNKVK